MPLRDHFHAPEGAEPSWEGFHHTWTICLLQALNAKLPPAYRAVPHIHLGVSVEADVATFEHDDEVFREPGANGGVATAVWAPPAPNRVAEVDFGTLDIFELQVYNTSGTRALVAAVELVSPANKDRLSHREMFAMKCGAYLQQCVSVVVVDVVTERLANLHEQIARRLNLDDDMVQAVTSPQYAVAYRTAGVGTRMRLEAWSADLAVGAALPTLPLWVGPSLAVPLDLETSYQAACASLRITP
jgi:hypothetical protein